MNKKTVVSLLAILVLTSIRMAEAQQIIFLARHGEQSTEIKDPPLTEAGKRRAMALATLLKDAGINVIYGSDLRRTIQTAEPLAKALNIEIKPYPRADMDGLISKLRTQHAQDRVLIVHHALRIPRLLKALGHPEQVKIPLDEYNNLFVIVPKADGAPLVIRLRY